VGKVETSREEVTQNQLNPKERDSWDSESEAGEKERKWGECEGYSIRGLREVEVKKELKMRKVHF